MAWIKAGPAATLSAGTMREVEHAGDRYVICNVEGELHAMDGICPHAAGPLAQGALHGHMVVCPWHAWEFDCRTGELDYNPLVRVDTFPVRVEDGEILIELPNRA
jgi:nitrite reductase/ring-hydroxylating ferredoxin subunit